MALFEESFPAVLRFAVQNLTFKMDVLEVFIIKQVGVNGFHLIATKVNPT